MTRSTRFAKQVQQAAPEGSQVSDRQAKESATKVLKYLDDYRSVGDTKALKDEGYEIDYDRLVGVGVNSAVFLAHAINSPAPPMDKTGQRPLYTPGYDVAAKVVAKKWINNKKPSKTRTGNLKLALALGQTKPENNILKVIDVFKTTDRIFIFMQYCAYGNVISFIRRNGQVPARLSQRWSNQMASALSFLHKFHVAHRNYKLENVLIDENLNAKLTGFGLSKFCIDLQTKQPILSKTICGSEPYLAPEMLKENPERNYDPKLADVWAFGVGVFLCITRRYPFEGENLRALKADQSTGKYLERDTKKRLRTSVRELLASAFTLDPARRPTIQDMLNRSIWLNQSLKPEATPQAKKQVAPQSPAVDPAQHNAHLQHHIQAHKRETSAGPQAGGSDEPLPEHLSPVTPMALQPSDALPVARATAPKIERSSIE